MSRLTGVFQSDGACDLLATTFRERVGLDKSDPDPVLLAACEKAARLTGLAEDATARAARGDPKVSLDDVVG